MSVIVISDLHIFGDDDPLYASLLRLIRETALPGDRLILAGDVFDLFVGEKEIFLARYHAFRAALREAGGRGVELHYIEGNHDFLIEGAFAGIPGLQIHDDQFSFEIDGKRFFFAHGDRVDRSDYSYRALRAFFRSPVMKGIVRVAPGEWLDWFGQTSSRKSRSKKPVLPARLPLGSLERLRKIYRSYAAEKISEGFDFVIMGHCHDLDEMHFQVGGREGQYVNVGYPRAHESYLRWSPGEAKFHREKLP